MGGFFGTSCWRCTQTSAAFMSQIRPAARANSRFICIFLDLNYPTSSGRFLALLVDAPRSSRMPQAGAAQRKTRRLVAAFRLLPFGARKTELTLPCKRGNAGTGATSQLRSYRGKSSGFVKKRGTGKTGELASHLGQVYPQSSAFPSVSHEKESF